MKTALQIAKNGTEQTRKRTKYIKTALQIAKNGTPINRKAKEQVRAEKANKCTDHITP